MPKSTVGLFVALFASTVWAQSGPVCSADQKQSLGRYARQVFLDLLGRPPTVAEYATIEARGSLSADDLTALMDNEDFYTRMKRYHQALLRSNVGASLNVRSESRVATSQEGAAPVLGIRSLATGALRGNIGVGCDGFIKQAQCNTEPRQDGHAEPAVKTCYDSNGVPLPVSYDYQTTLYQCTALTGATSCTDAVAKSLLPSKLLYFCDMRRQNNGSLLPFKCLPDPGKPSTAALTTEELDVGGKVIAFSGTPSPGSTLTRLERCTLDLGLRNGQRGAYTTQPGCIQREGFEMAAPPYWVTGATAPVATCAIEAQARPVNPATLETCEGGRFITDRSCGCGVNFARCEAGDGSTYSARLAAINEEPLQIADSVLRRDEDYFNVLTTRRSFVNGPLSSLLYTHKSDRTFLLTPPASFDVLPKLPFLKPASEWSEYVREDNASGVLTSMAYLYRFPTVRARVSHFYDAFLCKTFSPPPDAKNPAPEDSCNRENNLAKRCGCNYCHATIEPAGAHWGRYGERNAEYLAPEKFPRLSTKCRDCALAGNTLCDFECGNYVMQAYDGDGAHSLGLLRTYLYRTPEEEPNISGGPRLLVERMKQGGEMERCAVKRIWNEFLGRPMTAQEQSLYLDDYVDRFVAGGRNMKHLIRDVIASDAYRRVD